MKAGHYHFGVNLGDEGWFRSDNWCTTSSTPSEPWTYVKEGEHDIASPGLVFYKYADCPPYHTSVWPVHPVGQLLNEAVAPSPADAGTPLPVKADVVISQLYGAGGNAGALFDSDFVELHNRSSSSASVGGWTLQYASATGTTWSVGVIPVGTLIAAGGYLLVGTTYPGTQGAPLPSGRITLSRTLDLSSNSGKVALSRGVAAFSGRCPSGAVDFVGYGTANCAESSAAPSLSGGTAARRANDGCADSDQNQADFSSATPLPRAAPNVCP